MYNVQNKLQFWIVSEQSNFILLLKDIKTIKYAIMMYLIIA
ncbi:hypothetical protein RG47T_1521 [Mucilaginibacter polytrichastri]|uniref:Uncharacterized protein n=1 Tax=Mucilaginibacter polytrichastri TaxID=1302689 RepID=A0A1Q5ZWF5_9SPHI|nr:hypothetical protein RG47T_1521 [Mucilaginibacter polytrichastri]